MRKLDELKRATLEKISAFRLQIATSPKVILWRLKLFGIHPFLGNHFLKISGSALIVVLLFLFFYALSWRPPHPFPEQALITIERGEPLSQIAGAFEEKGIIRSSFWLRAFVIALGGEKRVKAGDYYFPSSVNLFKVTKMIRRGEYGLIAKKITIPEGTSSYEMAQIFDKELPAFDPDDFTEEVASNDYEGYLFPDTYFLTPNTKAEDIILMMRENFARQIKIYEEDILKIKKPLKEIVIMASIVEDEAGKSLESKRIIAGILWKRLKLGMPLQVDAPFQYYNGKNSYTLTKDDLSEDHEYNTYVNKGLPPTAITSPSINSLRAAIAPTQTEYLYFMSDKQGNVYYAKNFEGHKRNRELYLN